MSAITLGGGVVRCVDKVDANVFWMGHVVRGVQGVDGLKRKRKNLSIDLTILNLKKYYISLVLVVFESFKRLH